MNVMDWNGKGGRENDSSGGFASLCGSHTRKVLFNDLRNSFCVVHAMWETRCRKAREMDPNSQLPLLREHDCPINHHDTSASVESITLWP